MNLEKLARKTAFEVGLMSNESVAVILSSLNQAVSEMCDGLQAANAEVERLKLGDFTDNEFQALQ